MKKAFAESLLQLMENRKKQKGKEVYFMVGDLGYAAFEEIRKKYPRNFINAGISEQNMIGVASGFSLLGNDVFVYSIIPFLLYRTFEQIRNDICYHNLPVRLIGVGAGLAYSEAGSTHHPLEDLKVADSLPNLTILNPSDPKEVEIFMDKIKTVRGPVYMRLGKNNEPVLHSMHNEIEIGRALKLVEGDKILIVSTGILTRVALEVADMLNKEIPKSTEVLEIHTFKPFDKETLLSSSENKELIVTIEDNTGALYEKVTSAIAFTGKKSSLSFKFPDEFTHYAGTREHLFDSYGINTIKIYNKINEILK
jgi:transketolase